MRKVLGLILVVLAVVLSGCAQDNPQTGNMHMALPASSEAGSNNTFVQAFVVVAPAASFSSEGRQALDTKPDLNLGLNGGGASSAGKAEGAMKIVTEVVGEVKDKIAEKAQDTKEEVSKEDPVETTGDNKLTSSMYRGLTNELRPTWYFAEKAESLKGKDLIVEIPGMEPIIIENFNGERFEKGRFILKQSDVPGRGIAVLAPEGSPEPEKITIRY